MYDLCMTEVNMYKNTDGKGSDKINIAFMTQSISYLSVSKLR